MRATREAYERWTFYFFGLTLSTYRVLAPFRVGCATRSTVVPTIHPFWRTEHEWLLNIVRC